MKIGILVFLMSVLASSFAHATTYGIMTCEVRYNSSSVDVVETEIKDECLPVSFFKSYEGGRFVAQAYAQRPSHSQDFFSFIHVQVEDTASGDKSKFLSSSQLEPSKANKIYLILMNQNKFKASIECRIVGSAPGICRY